MTARHHGTQFPSSSMHSSRDPEGQCLPGLQRTRLRPDLAGIRSRPPGTAMNG
jgi:hypothetical protein